MKDKYTAIWVSHSSIGDYLKCPRAYYFKNVYRDPKTNHKVSLISPPLALGQAVHDVIESLSALPVHERFGEPLNEKFERAWQKISGKLGGFRDDSEEKKFKDRGLLMIARVSEHPGPLKEKAVKIRQDLPYFWLSEDDNIILCGKIDWLEYVEATDSVKILDFKTGKFDEDSDSLQLPIYFLLVTACQSRPVTGIRYWYIDRDTEPVDVPIPDAEKARARVVEIAKRVALARKLGRFICKNDRDGCNACRPLEKVIAGNAHFVGVGGFDQDIYVLS